MVPLVITIVFFILYSALIFYYWQSWKSLPEFHAGSQFTPLRFSIVIPARNEEMYIGRLLKAIVEQTYPRELIEVIVVDDHSTDATADKVRDFPGVHLIQLTTEQINSYKKKAIETGIGAATHEWIVATDADCIPPKDWLETISGFISARNSVFVSAPVVFDCNDSLIQVFQAIDFMVLQGITAASVQRNFHAMCNGANLAYKRSVFYEVEGFKGIDDIASGDDMLLMHKIVKRYPMQVHYLKSKSAMVTTEPMKTWKEFLNQRIRWASKAMRYDDKRIFLVLFLVYLFNLLFLVLLVAGFFNYHYWIYLGGLWIAKTIVEFPFFRALSIFFDKTWAIRMLFFFQPLHVAYTILTGLLGQFGKYEWKGRRVQ